MGSIADPVPVLVPAAGPDSARPARPRDFKLGISVFQGLHQGSRNCPAIGGEYELFAGLDVSMDRTSLCLVDSRGDVIWRGAYTTDPESRADAPV